MVRKIKFYKEKSGRWYADLPEWEGSKDDLEMVSGADALLDILAQGDEVIYAQMGDEKFPGANQLILLGLETGGAGGAWYLVPSVGDISFDLKIWLCDVTKFVFGTFPEIIWIYRSF
jgi:hypothetical protein